MSLVETSCACAACRRNVGLLSRRPQCDGAPTPLNDLARECHAEQLKWYAGAPTEDRAVRLFAAAKIALIHSEISETLEGVRKDTMDDKLPHRKQEEVEIADALIRIFDYAGWRGLDLDGAVREKRAFNATRADHTPEARASTNGKKF